MENNKWIGLLYFIILRQLNTSIAFDETAWSEESPLVEVRAVFIKCETKGSVQEESVAPDSDSIRFEREELFKHSVLRDCNKKLAVTVKISCEPETSGDEYLPIEHVFEGPAKKCVRLLDPYILRLRREVPLQAYKLRRVDTISGILLDTTGKALSVNYDQQRRVERAIGCSVARSPENELSLLQTNPTTPQGIHPLQLATPSIIKADSHPSTRYVENDICTNSTLSKRKKRNEHNIVVEEAGDDGKQWDSKEQYYRLSEPVKESGINPDTFDETEMNVISHRTHHRAANVNHKKETIKLSDTKPLIDEITKPDERSHLKILRHFKIPHSKEKESRAGRKKNTDKNKASSSLKSKEHRSHSSANNKRLDNNDDHDVKVDDLNKNNEDLNKNYFQESTQKAEDVQESPERDFAVYEIGHPELWYTVHVQLFEKLSTPDGKTVWNDLTKGEQASVSSKQPEWTGQDLSVRYRPAEWIPREEFSLPTSSLCLLAPIRGADSISYNENNTYLNAISEDGGYIVLPEEDVMGIKYEDGIINKRNDNNSDSEFSPKFEERNEQGHRRVVVRTSRALLNGNVDKVNIAFQGTDKYLTLPHRRPHHAQIDLEARADENELVRVGASGRIAIAVADSTRRTRTILTLQVGNTGLAAARFRMSITSFDELCNILKEKIKHEDSIRRKSIPPEEKLAVTLRVMTRDCGPALSQLVNDKNKQLTTAGPVLIPPRHTRSLRLELPLEIPVDMAHCSADDPRLLCREMAVSRQSAAGLSNRDRTRHARSACYKDAVYLNLCIIVTGVIFALLVLGFIKAIVGQLWFFIGTWGLDQLVQVPRKIDHYFESDISYRKVEYDCDGWPVHPDTRERTVRMYSRSMEFVLNLIFFVSVPCIMAYDLVKQLYSRLRKSKVDCTVSSKKNTKKCFSSQDMQATATRWRRRHGGLRRWMTPQAQELSKELWNKGLLPASECEFMRPLLREVRKPELHVPDPVDPDAADSCADSEQDDTEYVITQMQKSRESLSILKQKSKP